MHNYFDQDSKTQKLSLEMAAQRMGVVPTIIEKDLWVTLVLEALFSDKSSEIFVFKGGTSLSKGYGVIERFSEDIDVTIDRALFGTHFALEELAQLGRNERERVIEGLKSQAQQYIRTEVIPLLKEKIEGTSKEEIEISVSPHDPLSVEIFYPSFFREKYLYIKPKIYIEFGIRGELEPHEDKIVTSYLQQQVPGYQGSELKVRILAPIRTLYEKATLLHQEVHRAAEKTTPLRLSRHYYDLHQLGLKDYLKQATVNIDLLKAVINHKSLLFPSAWAQYDTILTQGIRLVPVESRIKDLQNDYQQMAEMFFGEYPSFTQILASIHQMEEEINHTLLSKR